MCKRLVIIKQFREFESLEELRARLDVRSGTPSLLTSCENLCARANELETGVLRGAMQGKQNLRFVLIATLGGPHGPAPDLLRARATARNFRRPHPMAARHHFIP